MGLIGEQAIVVAEGYLSHAPNSPPKEMFVGGFGMMRRVLRSSCHEKVGASVVTAGRGKEHPGKVMIGTNAPPPFSSNPD